MLTPAQIAFYRTFGVLRLRGHLAAHIGWITEEFESAWTDPAAPRHDGVSRTTYSGVFIAARPRLSSLLVLPAIEGVLNDLLGSEWSCYGGDGNLYAGDTGWHSDCVYMPDGWQAKTTTPHLKVSFYLDALTRETGALRVIPGSHHQGDAYCHRLDQGFDALGLTGPQVPSHSLDVVPGDLLLMDHRLKHASFGGGPRRRMFTINTFASCPDAARREGAMTILRGYRDLQKVDWTVRAGWLDWIDSLPAEAREHFRTIVALGAAVMQERQAIASPDMGAVSAMHEIDAERGSR